MPRRRKAPRLYLRRRRGRPDQWVILDGAREIGTGCGRAERDRAQAEHLDPYLAAKYTPPKTARLERLLVADILTVYAREHAPHTKRPDLIAYHLASLIPFWAEKPLAEIRGATCRAYVADRCAKGVSDQTARHDLKTLRAALRYYHREYGPLDSLPAVTLPPRGQPRQDWLRRDEVARLLRAFRRSDRSAHNARLVLVGIYQGNRPGATLGLSWLPSMHTGWVDIEAGVIHRRGLREIETRKRKPPVRIHRLLLPHMRRWREADLARGITWVIHSRGQRVKKVAKAWRSARTMAGLSQDIVAHTLRHTAATWLMQAGVPVAEAAGYLGMSIEPLWEVYGHHHPDFQHAAAQSTPKKRPDITGTIRR